MRTSTGLEVDLIIGNLELAVEIKSSDKIGKQDAKGLLALREDQPVKRSLLVCGIKEPREIEKGITALPWRMFCDQLWKGELV